MTTPSLVAAVLVSVTTTVASGAVVWAARAVASDVHSLVETGSQTRYRSEVLHRSALRRGVIDPSDRAPVDPPVSDPPEVDDA